MSERNAVASALLRNVPVAREEAVSLLTINTCFGATAEEADCERGGDKFQSMRIERPGPQCPQAARCGNNRREPGQGRPGAVACLPSKRDVRLPFVRPQLWSADHRRNRGVGRIPWRTITPRFHAGKSLSETWRYLEARFAAGKLSEAEVTKALERSVRRRSARIPVGIQRILLELLNAAGEGSCRLKPRSRRP